MQGKVEDFVGGIWAATNCLKSCTRSNYIKNIVYRGRFISTHQKLRLQLS